MWLVLVVGKVSERFDGKEVPQETTICRNGSVNMPPRPSEILKDGDCVIRGSPTLPTHALMGCFSHEEQVCGGPSRPGKGLVQEATTDLRLGVPPEFARRGSEDVQEDELVVPRLLKVARATQVVKAKVLRQLAVLLNILWNMKMQIEGMFFHILSWLFSPYVHFRHCSCAKVSAQLLLELGSTT